MGKEVIEHLLKITPKENFVALARNEEKAQVLKSRGIQVRIADFDDLSSLEIAFQGIDKLLLISTMSENRAEQQKAVVNMAKKTGVKHIVYTGISMKDVNVSALKMMMQSHFETENAIKESGLVYTFLRNNLYAEVIPMNVGEQVFDTGIYLPAGQGKAPFVLRREIGEAAAKVMVEEGSENKIYEITGGMLYSYEDVAQALSDLAGKEVHYTDADPAEFPEKLKQYGVPEFAVFVIAGFAEDLRNKQFEIVTDDLERLLGRKPSTLKAALKEIYNL